MYDFYVKYLACPVLHKIFQYIVMHPFYNYEKEFNYFIYDTFLESGLNINRSPNSVYMYDKITNKSKFE